MLSLQITLLLTTILFIIGLTGLMIRNNLLFILISIEIMLTAIIFCYITSAHFWQNIDGNIMFIFIITFAAAETSIFLILLLKLHNKLNTLNINEINEIHE